MKETSQIQTLTVNGEEIQISVINTLSASLKRIVEKNPTAVTELFGFVTMGAELSEESAQILGKYGFIKNDRAHDLTRSVVKAIITFEDGEPVILDLLKKQAEVSESAEVETAVSSLEQTELMALNMGLMLGGFGDHLLGYEKISSFVEDGKASPELKTAINKAMSNLA
jgi:hypothetical protein